VRKDDPAFALAAERFRRSVTAVERSRAGADLSQANEAAAEAEFLQAESLYRYRLEFRPQSSSYFGAQIAAAATDFTPLSSWAATSGMSELRLHAYDGAVQIYEDVLSRHPQTRLRPLVLYRLLWAYRSVSLSGFPRDSRTATNLLIKEFPDAPLAALALDAQQVPYKKQSAAVLWSIIPGAGHIYAGRTGNGVLRLSISLLSAAVAVTPIVFMAKDENLDWRGVLISLTGIVALQVSYASAYSDAQRSVLEFNERQEAAFERAHPEAP
jgi:hypothetical protein